ncbi:uncharacterized protein BJX67DRAFT_380889 [Aspergillus lucknowensis]|uniref:Uncharacterized protein n=1 Tax=Aspergillus lucknowensis TaxID=176173 RepID=A0ABR4LSU4_9EURO
MLLSMIGVSKVYAYPVSEQLEVTKGSFTVTFEPRVDLDISISKYVEMSDGYTQTKNAKYGWEASTNLASTELSLWFEMGLQLDGYKAVFQQSENLKIVKETVDGILDRIRNTTFWNWLT